MPRTRIDSILGRIYWRQRSGRRVAYADFRDFSDVGGRLEALIPPGERRATADEIIAGQLIADRLHALESRRALTPDPTGTTPRTFEAYAAHHLIQKAQFEEASPQWLATVELHLKTARDFFHADRDLLSIRTSHVQQYVAYLKARPSGRTSRNGTHATLSGGSIAHYLNSLSNLFNRAQSEELVPLGYNPVERLLSRPKVRRRKTAWFDHDEAAVLLDAARTLRHRRPDLALPFFYTIFATYLLTGCRETEVYGLRRDDVSLAQRMIFVRPNAWRRLKTESSERRIPIHSQLLDILGDYIAGPCAPASDLFFPATRIQPEQMITDLRKSLDLLPVPQRLLADDVEHVRLTMLRHTYCSARLQTLDRGQPISEWTVACEMGHTNPQMLRKVYGHVGNRRCRGEEVEFRIVATNATITATPERSAPIRIALSVSSP